MLLKFIDIETALPLRSKILRPGLPLSESKYDLDTHPQTFHVGATHEDKLLGVATFYPEIFSLFPEKSAYRLRGMAVDSGQQGKGVGKAILQFGEKRIETLAEIIWFNARESAFPFYLSLNYKQTGPIFDIPNIGPHKVMYKFLEK